MTFLNLLQSATSAIVTPAKPVSSAEAANQWLQSAHAEVTVGQSTNTSKIAVIILVFLYDEECFWCNSSMPGLGTVFLT